MNKKDKIENNKNKEEKFEEKVLLIRRVSKKTPGGNYITFSALVAVGNKNGKVGIGIGRSLEVPPAIQKASDYAKKHLIEIPIINNTIPFEISYKFKSAKILIKPAPEGTGLKVGSVLRILLDLAGVENASGKIIKSRNQIANSYAVINALKLLSKKNDLINKRNYQK